MPPLNKKRHQLEAARKSKGKCARSEKNRTVYEYDEQDDYEQINEELNDHMWVDEKIDKRAADYFDILLLAGRNNNVWKTSGRLIVNFGDSGRTLRRKKAVLKKAAQNIQPITFHLSSASAHSLASNTTSTCALSDTVVLVQSAEENREKNIEEIMERIMERNTKRNIEKNRKGIMKGIVERNTEENIEENKEGIIEGNTEKNMKENTRE
ncbi:32637_t:CDS:1, partial [Racocetra persica]